MTKDQFEDILFEIREKVENMRENGENDLRSVLFFIDEAIAKVQRG